MLGGYDEWKTTEPRDREAEAEERAEREAEEEEDRRQGLRRDVVQAYLAGKCLCENCTAAMIDRLQQI